jgi:hypothetical protein
VQIHLRCPCCPCHFSAPADAPVAAILERMTEEAPWFTLAEGKTFEDMVFAALGESGGILCPRCRKEALVGGESLGQYSDDDLLNKPLRVLIPPQHKRRAAKQRKPNDSPEPG